jgi:hypothetical protein
MVKVKYTHNKTGNYYFLLNTAIDCTDSREGKIIAIYCPVDDENKIYVRDLDEFHERFTLYELDSSLILIGN